MSGHDLTVWADRRLSEQERADDAGRPPREVTTFKLRDEWVRLAAVQKLSPILRVVGVRLAHFYNGKTGQLNPSYALLAAECVTTERTAQKAVAAFRKLGMIADTRSPGGRQEATNDFILIIPCRRVFTRTPVKPKSGVSKRTPVKPKSGAPRGVHAGSRLVSRSVFDGCPPVHPNREEENSVRNSERGEAAARTSRADRDSASNSTADDAPKPAPVTPAARAPDGALTEPVPARPPPPASPIGAAPNGAHADPALATVYRRAREVLGADADALTAKLLNAYDGDDENALAALACAEGEVDPVAYIEDDIKRALNMAREATP